MYQIIIDIVNHILPTGMKCKQSMKSVKRYKMKSEEKLL